MNIISWQEISIRLLFVFILGSAIAVEKKWYLTRQRIQSSVLIALGAAMFSILAHSASASVFPVQIVLGVSIICAGIFWHEQERLALSDNLNVVLKLWCAGAAGSLVGYGLFVPVYIGIFIILLISLLFPPTAKSFIPKLESELTSDPRLKNELSPATETAIPEEIYYQCQVNCLAKNEAEVLALLVQLGKEQKLTPTTISSKNIVGDTAVSEIEIRVDFVSEKDNSPLELQQLLLKLKSKANVSSAVWLNLSSELRDNYDVFLKKNKGAK